MGSCALGHRKEEEAGGWVLSTSQVLIIPPNWAGNNCNASLKKCTRKGSGWDGSKVTHRKALFLSDCQDQLDSVAHAGHKRTAASHLSLQSAEIVVLLPRLASHDLHGNDTGFTSQLLGC